MISKFKTQNNYVVDKHYLTIKKCLEQIERTNIEVANLNKLYGKNYRLIKLEGFVNKYIKVDIKDHNKLSKHKWYLNGNGDVINDNNILMHNL